MSTVTRAFDRILDRLAPRRAASASNTDKCYCQCSDACFFCCPWGAGYQCNVAMGDQCM
ncbi:hypothetical protein LX16_0767 [Stackebrandtia albiflava]|uniref:Uncharacterized protein n=1 Tax=Stackebrandtia albiflava TaxID=406432 RepID=A0A562VAZ9_9ACTN|nr:hypothetical protein [Stackebrandtia albiflava]TWJ15069.1 hypothetical protein LX16_0767 [Stackebrandtia albiflava]